MGSSVLGVGLCSATDWGGGYSGFLPPTTSQGGPSLNSGQQCLGLPLLYTEGRAWWWVGRWPSSYCTGSSRQGWAPAGQQHLSRALGSLGQAVFQAGHPACAQGAGVVLVRGLGSTTRPRLLALAGVPCTLPHSALHPAHLGRAQRCPS